jgi:uncharacterized protein (TIGR02594 family)
LSAKDVWEAFKKGGPKFAATTLLSALILGLADQFTVGVLPAIKSRAINMFDPPNFTLQFPTALDADALKVSLLDIGSGAETTPKFYVRRERFVVIEAAPGNYDVRLRRGSGPVAEELPLVASVEKPGQIIEVDDSESRWSTVAALTTGVEPSPSIRPSEESGKLTGTRWAAAPEDYAMVASAETVVARSILAGALAEVGIFEEGTDQEKARVLHYWDAAPGIPIGLETIDSVPWGGAFLGWIVQNAGVSPPRGAASFNSWLDWGEERQQPSPGLLAVFQMQSLPEAPSRLLVGVVLRQRKECVEIIGGNLVNRVAITCVAAPAISYRVPPADSAEMVPAASLGPE